MECFNTIIWIMFNMFAHDESHERQCTNVLVDACHDSKDNKKKLNVDNHNHIKYQRVCTKQNKTKERENKTKKVMIITSSVWLLTTVAHSL